MSYHDISTFTILCIVYALQPPPSSPVLSLSKRKSFVIEKKSTALDSFYRLSREEKRFNALFLHILMLDRGGYLLCFLRFCIFEWLNQCRIVDFVDTIPVSISEVPAQALPSVTHAVTPMRTHLLIKLCHRSMQPAIRTLKAHHGYRQPIHTNMIGLHTTH